METDEIEVIRQLLVWHAGRELARGVPLRPLGAPRPAGRSQNCGAREWCQRGGCIKVDDLIWSMPGGWWHAGCVFRLHAALDIVKFAARCFRNETAEVE